ncbi:hypothetical protein PspLS_01520 [Pyricularia sp. CBS 133598]|nr:hypothetical protein PspLS_01520 [Pyricularia sp. CBS 133598]
MTTLYTCDPNHPYRIEIISTSPLLIYIYDFLPVSTEIPALLSAGEPLFSPSRTGPTGQASSLRTSSSAGLPPDHPAVACILSRARRFMGATSHSDDDMGAPQLVRYDGAGQGFGLHHDWWSRPRPVGGGRSWNRVASFLVGLEDGCSGGETWFPFVEVTGRDVGEGGNAGNDGRKWTGTEPVWRVHPEGGVAFRPVAGNAVFWVNLHANGTGDPRTRHAGLPIGEGRKTAMNIWPRQYYGE